MKYRRKVNEVTAQQFWPNVRPWPEGVEEVKATGTYFVDRGSVAVVVPGDYIVTDEIGDIHVLPVEFFEQHFEEIQ